MYVSVHDDVQLVIYNGESPCEGEIELSHSQQKKDPSSFIFKIDQNEQDGKLLLLCSSIHISCTF
jgi:hypothetical protein